MKTTPGSLHLTHSVMYPGQYSGDEVLHITDRLEVIDNFVYIDNINTGINVKGEKGDSAYESYVKRCKEIKITPLSEKDWVDTIDTVMYVTIGGEQADWDQADTERMSYIQNKPMRITKTVDPETGDTDYDVEFL